MMKFYDNEPQTPTTRHCEPALALTRHSEGAVATEESTPKIKGDFHSVDSSPCIRKAQNDGVGAHNDDTSRHSERNEVERRIHEWQKSVNLQMDSSLRATHSAQNDGI